MFRQLRILLVAALLAGCSAPDLAAAPTFKLPPIKQQLGRVPLAPVPAWDPRLSQGPVSAGRFATLTQSRRGFSVAVVDVSTGLPLDLGSPPPWAGPAMPHISADGTLLVYDGYAELQHRLVAWDVNRKVEVRLKGLPNKDPRSPDVDAHGTTLIFIQGPPWKPQVAVFDVATGSEHAFGLPGTHADGGCDLSQAQRLGHPRDQ